MDLKEIALSVKQIAQKRATNYSAEKSDIVTLGLIAEIGDILLNSKWWDKAVTGIFRIDSDSC